MPSSTAVAPAELLQAVEAAAHAVADGRLKEEDLKPLRLAVGGHRQRKGDGYMLRLRVPGGRLSLAQFSAAADVAAAHASRAHLTSRQDLQLYHVALPSLARAAAALADAGISSYAAGGSTVRNITCGILGDQDPQAVFDPYPYAAALSARLSRHPLFNALPRKFKIGFAGPGLEQAQGWLNDLGFIPCQEQGRPGFRVVAGGGLGASPQSGLLIEAFIALDACGPYAEAALEHFAEHSRPDQPTANRFKFLVRSQGLDAVRRGIAQRLRDKPMDAPPRPAPRAEGPGLWIEAPLGDLSPAQMQGLARLLEAAGAAELRVSFDQRLLVPGVAPEALPLLAGRVQALGLRAALLPVDGRLVVCAGPETCNRGLVQSKALGRDLQALDLPLSLHISGCQNGCSQHLCAPLSLQGLARVAESRRYPAYALRVGGGVTAEGLHFGPVLATWPARQVRPALLRLLAQWRREAAGGGFEAWLRALGKVGIDGLCEDLNTPKAPSDWNDLDTEEAFGVSLGASECH